MQDKMGPPHGPMGLIEAPFYQQWSDYLWILIVFHIVLLLLLAFYLRSLKARRLAKAKGPAPEELRWQSLLLQCEELDAKLKTEQLDVRGFAFQLSSLLRQGMQVSYGLSARSQTLPELRLSLSHESRLPRPLIEELLAFFSWAEAVQFAADGQSPNETAVLWHQKVRTWLQQWREARL